MSTSTTVLVVDDHALVREGLSTVLDLQPDLSVVGTAAMVWVGGGAPAMMIRTRSRPGISPSQSAAASSTGADVTEGWDNAVVTATVVTIGGAVLVAWVARRPAPARTLAVDDTLDA